MFKTPRHTKDIEIVPITALSDAGHKESQYGKSIPSYADPLRHGLRSQSGWLPLGVTR